MSKTNNDKIIENDSDILLSIVRDKRSRPNGNIMEFNNVPNMQTDNKELDENNKPNMDRPSSNMENTFSNIIELLSNMNTNFDSKLDRINVRLDQTDIKLKEVNDNFIKTNVETNMRFNQLLKETNDRMST